MRKRLYAMRGMPIALEVIDKPQAEWDSLLHVFQDALAHEQMISALIQKTVDVARRNSYRAAE